MVNEQIEVLREKLNSMLNSNSVSKQELLRASEELDVLIVNSMKEQCKKKDVLNEKIVSELDNFLDRLRIFNKIYESLRLVDPISKKVYEIINDKPVDTGITCHAFWGRNKACDNCISMRAIEENNSFYKLEIKEGSIYLITAVPVIIEGKRFAVEMLKDVTNSMILNNGMEDEGEQAYPLIEYMNKITVKDALTDLYNRRFMNERLHNEIMKIALYKEPFSFIFADIDFFKKVNDTYGHTAGDYILREVSKEIRKHIGKENFWAARYGGDEFFICLPNTKKEKAIMVAGKIHKGIERKKFIIDKQIVSITCSFGVDTVLGENKNLSVDDVIKMADRKLYEAKSKGRNIVV